MLGGIGVGPADLDRRPGGGGRDIGFGGSIRRLEAEAEHRPARIQEGVEDTFRAGVDEPGRATVGRQRSQPGDGALGFGKIQTRAVGGPAGDVRLLVKGGGQLRRRAAGGGSEDGPTVRPQVGGSSLSAKATRAPSGEKSGAVSAAPVAAKGLIAPEATSTTEMSDRPQSSATGAGVWSKTIVLPSGDQSQDPTVNPPWVRRRVPACRRRPWRPGRARDGSSCGSSPTTRASFFAFWSFLPVRSAGRSW